MSDDWPSYHEGRRDHLHAVGVIAVSFSAFQRGLLSLYAHHPQQQKMPYELVELYYSALNEKMQLKAIRTIFAVYEHNEAALAFANQLVAYFDWCSDVRNKLLHSELYPPFFGGEADKLYLIKREKREPNSSYLWLTVAQLRDLADKIEAGKRQAAAFLIYLRIRDIPQDQLPRGYAAFVNDAVPDLLVVPPTLELSPHPQHGAMPDYLKK
jgi:hypothetical protein